MQLQCYIHYSIQSLQYSNLPQKTLESELKSKKTNQTLTNMISMKLNVTKQFYWTKTEEEGEHTLGNRFHKKSGRKT